MKETDIKIGDRVRVPAYEKPGGGRHYAVVLEKTPGLFGEGPLVIVRIPVLGVEKVFSPESITPARLK